MVEVFPFAPNWSEGVEHQLSYKTDIFTSRSGKEQRRALRQTPRRTVSYSSMLVGDEMVKFQRLLATKQNADFYLPDWSHVAFTHGVERGASCFTIRGVTPEWLAPDTTVFLIDPLDGTTLPVAVQSASGYTVTLTEPVERKFSHGTMIRLCHAGLIGDVATTSNSSNVVTARVTFDVKPASRANSTNSFFPYAIGGKEVFGFAWNWGEVVTSDYAWSVEKVDFGRGATRNYRPVHFGSVTQKVTIVGLHDEIDTIARFYERQHGQRNLFMMPSGTSDIELGFDVENGSNTLTVKGSEVFELFSGTNEVYRAVAIYTRDNRKIFRKVQTIGLTGSNSTIRLSDPLTFALPVALVAKISWLRPARFASDDQTVEYLTSEVAQLQFTTKTVNYVDDSLDHSPFDGAGNWVMDNWGDHAYGIFQSLNHIVNVVLAFGDMESQPFDAFDDLVNSEIWGALGGQGQYEPPVSEGIPTPPLGYDLLVDTEGTYILADDGEYLISD